MGHKLTEIAPDSRIARPIATALPEGERQQFAPAGESTRKMFPA
jgi:hypothetical protein